MTIRLLALDLDGTLFGDDLVIVDRLRSAIKAAQDKGVVVTIATGRMFRSARQVARDLDIAEPLICYQGALIQHSATGDVLYHKTVPLEISKEIIRETTERGLHLNVYLNDDLYVDQVTPEARYYSQINMDLPITEVGDLGEWLDKQGGAEPTKLVIVTNPDTTDATLELFSKMFGDRLQVTKSHPRFTEFTNKECSKGRAMEYLAGKYGITRDEVMAIGDGLNDEDMIAWAGYGVAMGTSPQSVRDAARVVTGSLSEVGAAQVIERYILEEDD